GKIYRDRLWALPDQFIYTEDQFHRLFPDDAYQEENDYRTWEKAAQVFATVVNTTAAGMVAIPAKTWKSEGWYVIELRSQDDRGREILEKKYCYVVHPTGNGVAQQALVVASSEDQYEP